MSGSLPSIGADGLPSLPAGLAALELEAEAHEDAVTPAVLAAEARKHAEDKRKREEKIEAEARQREKELQEEPEIIDLPVEIEVIDAATLDAEVSRLCSAMASTTSSPWTARVGALKRVSQLCRAAPFESVRALPAFPTQLHRLRMAIVAQLSDRRSLVVKQACATLSTLSGHFKATYLSDAPADADASARTHVDNARHLWLEMTSFYIDALLPLIPITVQVIQASACLCLSAIVKNVAGLYIEGDYDYPLLRHLCASGTTHKHGIVRDHCYRAIANSMLRIDPRYLAHESELDREAAERIRDKAAATAAAAAAAAAAADDGAAAAPAPSPDSSSSSTVAADADALIESALFAKLESTVAHGIKDSFDKTRAAARLCLIHLRTIAPARAERIIASMTAAQQKVFQQRLDDYLTNGAIGAAEASKSKSAAASSNGMVDEPQHNASDDEMEAELNPPPAATGKHKRVGSASSSAASTSAGAAPSAKLKSHLRKKKAAVKGKKAAGGESSDSDSGIEVVTGKRATGGKRVSPAEAAEKKKEQDAARALASKTKSSDDDADAADEESTPVTGASKKQRSKDSEDSEEDDSDDDDDDSDGKTVSSSGNVATSYARNITLLSKLLDLENPMLTDKMVDFLLHEGVIDVFISFIARVDRDLAVDKLADVKSFADLGARYTNQMPEGDSSEGQEPVESDVPLSYRARPGSDDAAEQTATRRSYNVMHIMCGQRQSQSLMAVLTSKIPAIVLRLMCVFHPSSKGNFFHACAVLQKLLSVFPGTVLTAICSPPGRTLLSLMLDHLHEPPVIPCLLALVQASVESKIMGSSVPTDIVLHMRNADLLHTKLVARMVAAPCPSQVAAQAASDFICMYIEKMQSMQVQTHALKMVRLLEDVAADGKAVAMLVGALVDSSSARPAWQLSNVALVLHTLLTASSAPTVTIRDDDVNAQALAQMMGTAISLIKHVPNAMHPLKDDITTRISDKLVDLCEVLTEGGANATAGADADAAPSDSSSSSAAAASAAAIPSVTFSSYVVPACFTSRRLQLLRIIVALIDSDLSTATAEADALAARVNAAATAPLLSAPRLFSRIPAGTWSTLIDWFFLYVHNNFYLNNFKTLFLSLLRYALRTAKARDAEAVKAAEQGLAAAPSAGSPSSSDALFKILLHDLKFVTRMVAYYTSAQCEASCTRSYVLELSNHLRLSADLLSHSSFVWSFLQASQQWQSFLPLLRQEATLQSRNLHVPPYEEAPRDPHREALERALGLSIGGGGGGPPQNPDAFVIPEGYGEGIDLGSVFAYHLGYPEKHGASAGKKKKKKKKNKKKKNKQTEEGGAGAGAAGDDEPDDDDEDASESDTSMSSVSSASSPAPSPVKAAAT